MIRKTFMVCLALTLALTGTVFAQGVQTATITGTVTGPDGAPLPGVTVTATSPAMLGERQAVTGPNGDYVLRGLTPGNYNVKVSLEGMQTFETQVQAPLGTTARADAALRLTNAAETITVTAEAPSALETTTVGTNITAETVSTLPVIRTPIGIASLSGSVVEGNRTPVAGQLSISGGMSYDNAFLVNGVNVQDPIFGTVNNLFIEDSILETQVLTSGISAEYGHFTGGVLNAITKSGGNNFSGSLRGDLTKPSWRDQTAFEEGFRGFRKDATEKPRATNAPRVGAVGEIYSATLGGPVLRDRLWFFGAVRDEENTAPQALSVSGVNVPRVLSNRRMEGKITGNITANHTLQASYIDNPDKRTHEIQVVPLTLDAVGLNSVRENEGTVFSYTGVLSNNLFAEARYSEKTFGFRGLGGTSTAIVDSPIRSATRFPGNTVAGTFNAPFFDATDPEDRNNEQYFGALSYFLSTGMGTHDLKGGVERFTVTRTGGNSQTATGYVFLSGYQVTGGAPVFTNGRLNPVFTPCTPNCTSPTNTDWSAIQRWIPTRGALLDTTTDSLFINDRWDISPRFSVSLGARHEIVTSEATGDITAVDTETTVPRLGLSVDPLANGRFKVDVTYAEYAGRYNPSIVAANSPVGNPAVLVGRYQGPAGTGRDFAPGFDPANYLFYYARVPTANQFFEDGLSSPVNKEYTLSGGMALPRGGWFKATYINRDLTGVIENFITYDLGKTAISYEGVNVTTDNVYWRNTDEPKREYEAVQLQANYAILRNWSVEGNYTHQIKNHGNYEGEGGQTIGTSPFFDRPEIQAANENAYGRLPAFQGHRARLWTTYNSNLGRAGTLSTGLIYRYDSGQTFTFQQTGVARTAAQLARNPGYASTPTQTVIFGERGAGEFNDTHLFDLALSYSIPVWRSLEPYMKVDVRNLFNDDTLIAHNTTVFQDATTPLDSDGLRTGYTMDNPSQAETLPTGLANPNRRTFGDPRTAADYVIPREVFVSLGLRF
jgi:hypothetical protein